MLVFLSRKKLIVVVEKQFSNGVTAALRVRTRTDVPQGRLRFGVAMRAESISLGAADETAQRTNNEDQRHGSEGAVIKPRKAGRCMVLVAVGDRWCEGTAIA
jgi:hypothetical protein